MAKSISECVILHVEDDDAVAYLFQVALRESELNPQLYRVTNGVAALLFLEKREPYGDAPTPDLVLLDLNLPARSGFDVLAESKALPELIQVKFYVFSTSLLPHDRERALLLSADGFITKPIEFDDFIAVAKEVCRSLGAA